MGLPRFFAPHATESGATIDLPEEESTHVARVLRLAVGAHVRVFDGLNRQELAGFFAYDPRFTGGVFITAGDVNGDGRADVITGAGASGDESAVHRNRIGAFLGSWRGTGEMRGSRSLSDRSPSEIVRSPS